MDTERTYLTIYRCVADGQDFNTSEPTPPDPWKGFTVKSVDGEERTIRWSAATGFIGMDEGNYSKIDRVPLSTYTRQSDGKSFINTDHNHWTTIVALDGEEDCVKWLGDDTYVGRTGGSYLKIPLMRDMS